VTHDLRDQFLGVLRGKGFLMYGSGTVEGFLREGQDGIVVHPLALRGCPRPFCPETESTQFRQLRGDNS
jgi:hypothetical protein